MKLREVRIRNFRNLVDVVVPIGDTTILIGANNSGKTAFLEAVRIVLTRIAARRQPFHQYDYHMTDANQSPEDSEGISIELWFREDTSDEWPSSLAQALDPIINTDPYKDLDSVGIRLTSRYDASTKVFADSWEFLNLDGRPLPANTNVRYLGAFLEYVRVFYLSALRDSGEEFSSSSQFWGRILRDVRIPQEARNQLAGGFSGS
jgi:putative ATP-dependent endonuclease of the OLD family